MSRPDDTRETARRLAELEERVKFVTTGVGAPAFQPEKGRVIYVRQDGSTDTTLYVWEGTAWVPK